MIHIPIDEQTPAADWLDESVRHLTELTGKATIAEKFTFIDGKQPFWRKLKAWLLGLSNQKCWYSEAKEIYSHYEVDHFRPKKGVVKYFDDEIDRPDGYWWLAFDWKNYRVCGDVGNKKKGNRFPVKGGIALQPGDDINNEAFYLLDPTNADDVMLITFDETGFPIATADIGQWNEARVEASIEILDLKYALLVDERKKVWQTCVRKINRIQQLIKERDQNPNPSVHITGQIRELIRELREMTSRESELAGTARACLLKSNWGWARKVVESSI